MTAWLLDTQVLFWMVDDPDRLPLPVVKLLEDKRNRLHFSLVSIWEASIKFALGRPEFTMPPAALRDALLQAGLQQVPIASEHVIAVARLPHLHRDPFDRLLVVQAEVEGLTLMTTDKKLAQYGPHVQRFK